MTNVLPHLGATIALLWLMMEMFTTYDERLLGVAVLAFVLLYIVLTGFHMVIDWNQLSSKRRGGI